jgi:hypothetical protein
MMMRSEDNFNFQYSNETGVAMKIQRWAYKCLDRLRRSRNVNDNFSDKQGFEEIYDELKNELDGIVYIG